MVELALEIAGRSYKLRVPESQRTGLIDTAQLLDQQIVAMKARSRQLNSEQAAVLAALQLCYDLMLEREMLAADRTDTQQRLSLLQQQLDSVCSTMPIKASPIKASEGF